jgi:hypothetical protein
MASTRFMGQIKVLIWTMLIVAMITALRSIVCTFLVILLLKSQIAGIATIKVRGELLN